MFKLFGMLLLALLVSSCSIGKYFLSQPGTHTTPSPVVTPPTVTPPVVTPPTVTPPVALPIFSVAKLMQSTFSNNLIYEGVKTYPTGKLDFMLWVLDTPVNRSAFVLSMSTKTLKGAYIHRTVIPVQFTYVEQRLTKVTIRESKASITVGIAKFAFPASITTSVSQHFKVTGSDKSTATVSEGLVVKGRVLTVNLGILSSKGALYMHFSSTLDAKGHLSLVNKLYLHVVSIKYPAFDVVLTKRPPLASGK